VEDDRSRAEEAVATETAKLEATETAKLEATETARLEAFSDGVFAVAITLLALDLRAPVQKDVLNAHGLAGALAGEWPQYLAYALSFLSILIMWVNHHHLFIVIRRTDHFFLLLNGFLLMVITAIPFATNVLSVYLVGSEKQTAQVMFSGVYLLMAITFNAMWRYASAGKRLLGDRIDVRKVQDITRQFRFGPILYLAAFGLAFASAVASLALCVLLAVFYALPSSITRAMHD